jgi:hypothetical protein
MRKSLKLKSIIYTGTVCSTGKKEFNFFDVGHIAVIFSVLFNIKYDTCTVRYHNKGQHVPETPRHLVRHDTLCMTASPTRVNGRKQACLSGFWCEQQPRRLTPTHFYIRSLARGCTYKREGLV